MARKLKVLLNIGLDDQKTYGIPDGPDGEPPHDGDVIDATDQVAHVLVNVLKCAKDYDAKEEREHAEKVRQADADRLAPEVANRLAREQVEKDVTARVTKGGKDFDRLDQPETKAK